VSWISFGFGVEIDIGFWVRLEHIWFRPKNLILWPGHTSQSFWCLLWLKDILLLVYLFFLS